MKHIKSYKIFESISGTDLELDVRDMFLENNMINEIALIFDPKKIEKR